MSQITKIEVETWTRNVSHAGTNDRIDAKINFDDGRSFQQRLDNPNHDDFEAGQRDRFNLDLTTASAEEAVQGQTVHSIKSIKIIKMDGHNMWKCAAVGILVNDIAVLSRDAFEEIEYADDSFTIQLRSDGKLDGLQVNIKTADVNRANTDDPVYCSINFENGEYQILDLRIDSPYNDFEKGDSYTYLIPLLSEPELINYYPFQITDFSIRKSGSNGWLLQSAELYANGDDKRLLGNKNINQFLDNNNKVLNIRKWSSINIIGPVLGLITDSSAKVIYRVENTGKYRLKLYNHGSSSVYRTSTKNLNPTGTFTFNNLESNQHYDFKLFFVNEDIITHLPDYDGELRTFPEENEEGVRFSFAVGSCARNRDNPTQLVWSRIKNNALQPSQNPETISNPEDYIRFFIHLGDTFYFYDDVIDKDLANVADIPAAASAANLSSRLNTNFINMAKVVPTCAIWDDHDFRHNDLDSVGFNNKNLALDAYLEYWGNPDPFHPIRGLTSRMSYGNVDIYLMDSRYLRNNNVDIYFTEQQVDFILNDMQSRNNIPRLRILACGDTWNHELYDGEGYGHRDFDTERESFYSQLSNLFGNTIHGLVFISGDIHINEMYEIKLPLGGKKVAPEIVSSPIGKNSSLKNAREITGERKWSKSSKKDDGKYWGYTTLEINTKIYESHERWTLTVRYWRESDGINYKTKHFILEDDQFRF